MTRPDETGSTPSADRRGEALGWIAPPLFVVLWATGFVVARLVAPYSEPFTFLAARFALATLLLAILAHLLGASWPDRAGWRNGLAAGILLHGGYLGAVFWSVKNGLPAGISALIAGLQPLVTAALAQPLLGERVSPRRWLGIAIGFAGALLVLSPKIGEAAGFSPLVLGVAFLGTLSMTAGTLWQKRVAGAADLRTNTLAQYVGATAFVLPLALVLEEGRLDPVPELLIGLVWSVVAMSIGAIFLLLHLLRKGAVAGVAALLYLVPPVAALMSYVLFGETLTAVQIVGMALAAAGVAVASRG